MNRPALLALFALVTAPLRASAYELEKDSTGQSVRWNGPVTFYIDGHARDVSESDAVAAAQRAAAHWTEVAHVEITIVVEDKHGKPGYRPDEKDNRSEILFLDDGWDLDDGVVATTLVTTDTATHRIIDADILINGAEHRFALLPDGSTSGTGLTDDLEAALTHEMGHALGLAHNPELSAAAMYPSTVHGEVSKRHLASDDIAGVQSLYGAPGSHDAANASAASNGMPATGCSSGVGGDALLGLLVVGLALRARRSQCDARA